MPLVILGSRGRGTHYTAKRGLVESALRLAYRGDWPAALWGAIPSSCQVKVRRIIAPVLSSGTRPPRVGFVSDIHIGPTTPPRLLDAAFAHLAQAALDVLLLGGDYVFLDADAAKARTRASLVNRVPAARKFAVLGNHDLWTHHGVLEEALTRAGVHVLNNESRRLDGDSDLFVVGLDEPWTGALDAAAAVRGAAAARSVLVLCHSPDGMPAAVRAVNTLPHAPPRSLPVRSHSRRSHRHALGTRDRSHEARPEIRVGVAHRPASARLRVAWRGRHRAPHAGVRAPRRRGRRLLCGARGAP